MVCESISYGKTLLIFNGFSLCLDRESVGKFKNHLKRKKKNLVNNGLRF